ncbi:FecR protein [Bremerella volcania]|uniref:FecR protein n=1 Tax=Bremerella volcania TaxID=2527984 RepID=A0A518C9G5_9BACT|nr:LamG-like jellyroll fold domain-containing protein [Bremerella volcania]QDU75865.1 FecR protein [Bremerella volcania]
MTDPEELMSKYLFGLSTDYDSRQLKQWLKQTPENVREFTRAVYLHQAIRDHLSGEEVLRSEIEADESASPANDTCDLANSDHSESAYLPQRRTLWFSIALSLLVGIGITAWTLVPPFEQEIVGVARVLEQRDAVFESSSMSPHHSGILSGGTYSLTNGELLIRFHGGALGVIRAPTQFQINSISSVRLHRGQIAVTCPSRDSRGFRVKVPHGDIVDLGTEFGVEVDKFGDAHVYVFQGTVVAQNANNRVTLKVGDAARISKAQGVVSANVSPSTFYRQRDWEMPSLLKRAGGEANLANDSNLLLWLPMSRLQGQTTPVNLAMGGRNPVVLQTAIAFHASDSGLHELSVTNSHDALHMNVPGNHRQLTLAAWVRFSKEQGPDREHRGILMSDSFQDRGEVHWQRKGHDFRLTISTGKRGQHEIFRAPTGRLENDRWYHLASVIDLDQRKVTHYLDGVEVGQQRVQSVIGKVSLGECTLGAWAPGAEPETDDRSLNGDLDDVMIWNRALDAEQIRSLADFRSQ